MISLERLVGFDLETTGVDVYDDDTRIVTSAFVLKTSEGTKAHELEMNPGIDIPTGASDVHGITTEKAQGFMPYLEGLTRMKQFLDWTLYEEIPIVAYNGAYDITLTRVEFERHGIPLDWDSLILLDPLVMDRHLDPFRKGGRKLGRVAELYGYDLTNAHEATADCLAALHIADRIIPKFCDKIEEKFGERPETPKDFMELQSALYRNQMTDLERYFRKSDPSKTINKSWPFQNPEE